MAAEIVKLLKAIGSYSEAEISDAVHTSLNAADKGVFRGYARVINDELYGAPTVNVAKKEKAKKNHRHRTEIRLDNFKNTHS